VDVKPAPPSANPVRRALRRYSPAYLAGWGLRRTARLLTGRWRTLPDFIIIGAQRCGTTSLYNYLVERQAIVPAFMKEVHFYDNHFHQGLNWYRSFFPLEKERRGCEAAGRPFVTGEATPYYLIHPHAPRRVHDTLPGVRLIVLLRNPVDRALSQYHHQVRMGLETLSFEEAIEKEERVLAAERERVAADQVYQSPLLQSYSYLARGVYVDQLQAWLGFFPRQQVLILRSEDFYADVVATVAQVLRFLGLPAARDKAHAGGDEYRTYNQGEYGAMDAALRARLVAYFAPHNRRLYDYLGVDLGWDN